MVTQVWYWTLFKLVQIWIPKMQKEGIKVILIVFLYFVNFYDIFEIVKRTPMHIAIENGFTEMTLNLIQAGVELDTKDSSGRYIFPEMYS